MSCADEKLESRKSPRKKTLTTIRAMAAQYERRTSIEWLVRLRALRQASGQAIRRSSGTTTNELAPYEEDDIPETIITTTPTTENTVDLIDINGGEQQVNQQQIAPKGTEQSLLPCQMIQFVVVLNGEHVEVLKQVNDLLSQLQEVVAAAKDTAEKNSDLETAVAKLSGQVEKLCVICNGQPWAQFQEVVGDLRKALEEHAQMKGVEMMGRDSLKRVIDQCLTRVSAKGQGTWQSLAWLPSPVSETASSISSTPITTGSPVFSPNIAAQQTMETCATAQNNRNPTSALSPSHKSQVREIRGIDGWDFTSLTRSVEAAAQEGQKSSSVTDEAASAFGNGRTGAAAASDVQLPAAAGGGVDAPSMEQKQLQQSSRINNTTSQAPQDGTSGAHAEGMPGKGARHVRFDVDEGKVAGATGGDVQREGGTSLGRRLRAMEHEGY